MTPTESSEARASDRGVEISTNDTKLKERSQDRSPGAEVQFTPLVRPQLPAMAPVLVGVLAVAVGAHDRLAGMVRADEGEAGAQGGPLAPVLDVGNHPGAGGCGPLEHRRILEPAAVVDDQYPQPVEVSEFGNQGGQPVVRLKGGNQQNHPAHPAT